MNLTTDQLAELLSGVARAQTAIIDAIERANGGWRSNHLIPLLSIAANMRSGEPRLVDLPARVLLRYQGRSAADVAAIKADLERLLAPGGGAGPAAAARKASGSSDTVEMDVTKGS